MGDWREMSSKKLKTGAEGEEEIRISSLTDDLIHHILSFTDTKTAIQACTISKLWKNMWQTLPHLYLDVSSDPMFATRLMCRRNNESHISSLTLVTYCCLSDLTSKIVRYAISHNVQELNIRQLDNPCCQVPDCEFSSSSLETLRIEGGECNSVQHSSWSWNLPALRNLYFQDCFLPRSFDGLLRVTNLCLKGVKFNDKTVHFSTLVNLMSLALIECQTSKVLNISCVKLTNLTISSSWGFHKLVVSAPDLSSFHYYGKLTEFLFSKVGCLDQVSLGIKFQKPLKNIVPKVMSMLNEVGNAKSLTVSANIMKVFSVVPSLKWPPFENLKVLNGKGLRISSFDSSIPFHIRSYLLTGSPSASFVKEIPKEGGISMRNTLEEALECPL